MTVNYNAQTHGTNQKPIAKQAIIGSMIGALVFGGGRLGYQKFVISEYSKDYFDKVATNAFKDDGKSKFWKKVFFDIADIRINRRIDSIINLRDAGKVALFGGALIGGITAIVAACKKLKANR